MAVFLSLGSNIGDRQKNLQSAISMLYKELPVKINAISPVYETEPFGNIKQNWFYNIVCCIDTDIQPNNLLFLCKSIEYALGRRKAEHWTARAIDIDILLYDNLILETATLTVPHKYLVARRFVLAPFKDIAPGCMHPVLNKTIQTLFQNCKDNSIVKQPQGTALAKL